MKNKLSKRIKKDIIQLASDNSGSVFDTLNQSQHAIWWVGKKGKLLMANIPFLEYSGFQSLDDLQGAHYSEQPSEGGKYYRSWEKQDLMTSEDHGKVEILSYLKPTGSSDRGLFHCIKNPAYAADGSWIGTVNHGFDISNSKIASWLPIFYRGEANLSEKTSGGFTYVLTEKFENKRFKTKLTKRQSECLFLLLRGFNAREMATILSLSRRTVEDHLELLAGKLGANTRSEIISVAIEMGFFNLIPKGYLSKLLETVKDQI